MLASALSMLLAVALVAQEPIRAPQDPNGDKGKSGEKPDGKKWGKDDVPKGKAWEDKPQVTPFAVPGSPGFGHGCASCERVFYRPVVTYVPVVCRTYTICT